MDMTPREKSLDRARKLHALSVSALKINSVEESRSAVAARDRILGGLGLSLSDIEPGGAAAATANELVAELNRLAQAAYRARKTQEYKDFVAKQQKEEAHRAKATKKGSMMPKDEAFRLGKRRAAAAFKFRTVNGWTVDMWRELERDEQDLLLKMSGYIKD